MSWEFRVRHRHPGAGTRAARSLRPARRSAVGAAVINQPGSRTRKKVRALPTVTAAYSQAERGCHDTPGDGLVRARSRRAGHGWRAGGAGRPAAGAAVRPPDRDLGRGGSGDPDRADLGTLAAPRRPGSGAPDADRRPRDRAGQPGHGADGLRHRRRAGTGVRGGLEQARHAPLPGRQSECLAGGCAPDPGTGAAAFRSPGRAGHILRAFGDESGALRAYEEGLRINPHMPAIRAEVARLRQRLEGNPT